MPRRRRCHRPGGPPIPSLVDGYTLRTADGDTADTVHDARIAIEGGFAHIKVAGYEPVQVVSAPAVALITYRPES
ncbi:hypothetical protein NN3_39980 [Nocardia neocaledoniensis NBRC 108232]|nr:hypothetical protein NN3_39980 [Nocardia neocaledoniensis NBRC 108232]